MQRPADAALDDQRIGLNKGLSLSPTGGAKQQHAASTITAAADAISPITTAGLMALAIQFRQPGEMGRNHRIKLGLRNQTQLQLHKGRANHLSPFGIALPAASI